ncbi:endonuclease/exonuclease/phosphatase family protein [Streptomyces seoulensis]|uniref:endonuclease/exonuclease/phosphatase family protein n=1 Tax=Streptomyces seoulensis TaxID=73044 RepID=UPI00068FC233|nr:endonuclease/exonuclease/phosphatase family protein [Streptomyces seoulensis]
MFSLPARPRLLRQRHGRRRALAATAIVAALAAGVTAALTLRSPHSPAPGTLTVATWNMCGIRQWHCAATGSPERKRRALTGLVTDDGARVVLLQEACAGDVAAVRRTLGTSWHTAFRPYLSRDAVGRTAPVRCAGAAQGEAGYAILAGYPLVSVASVPAQQPTVGVTRGILCATVKTPGIRVCDAHLSPAHSDAAHPGWEFRDDQLKALAAAVPSRRTVYGGDLNVNPPGPRSPASWVWPAGPYTVQRECAQTSATSRAARPTHASGHKLDYLFTGLERSRCTVRDLNASDHYALVMRVRTG